MFAYAILITRCMTTFLPSMLSHVWFLVTKDQHLNRHCVEVLWNMAVETTYDFPPTDVEDLLARWASSEE